MKAKKELLMTAEEGRKWHEYKATCGPIYPGYESFDNYMNWMKDRLAEYGCIDFLEHHWDHESYRVNDWPVWDTGAMELTVDGQKLDVGTFLMFSQSTGEEGITAPLVYYDVNNGEPEDGAFEGKIVVIEDPSYPEKPFDQSFLYSYVVTDTNYRSDPKPPAPMLEIVDPQVSNSWNTRWSFFNWALKVKPYAMKGKAKGLLIASNLTLGCLRGLYDRHSPRPIPSLVIDRVTSKTLVKAAKEGKTATMKLVSEFFHADAWNFVCFLPGVNYGTDKDEYIAINVHTDAMSLTQDNGSLGALGIAKYFSQVPQDERQKTLLFCIDSRHFIEGFEQGNIAHDPYKVYPELVEKVTVSVGLEHMGEMEGAEDYEHNTMVPTGLPEYSFMKADDNDFCARTLIEAAIDSGLERADIKIDGRPGIHGMFKGFVRAMQAICHQLDVCVIGEAGNWCGAHTQTFSTMQYFGEKKFRDEVHLWTQVVGCLMETDSRVYDISWHKLNTQIRKLNADGKISYPAMDGLLSLVSGIFSEAEAGEYSRAANRLNKEVKEALLTLLENEDCKDALFAVDKVIEKISA